MAHGTAFWTAQTQFLDEEFDAPDAMADAALCRAIVTGRMGLHPDAWGNHDPLTTPPPHHREPFVPPVGFPGDHSHPDEWRPHTPRPKPKPRFEWPAWHPHTASNDAPARGEVKLTCDDCEARYRVTMHYRGNRPAVVQSIRLMGKTDGWTCIVGTDRCPACSQALDQGGNRNGQGQQGNGGGKVEGHWPPRQNP